MRRPTLKRLSLILAILLSAPAVLGQEFQIRTRVDLVVVPFTVKGADGRPVYGLTEEDFEVYEDGRRQSIEEFSIDPPLLSAVLAIDVGVDAASLAAVQTSIPSMVGAFGDFDEVAVLFYDDEVEHVLNFTSDPELLRTSLEKLNDRKPTSQLVGGERVGPPSVTVNGIPSITTATRPITRDKRVLHDAVYEAALLLRGRAPERRKIVLVVSDGNDASSEIDPDDVELQLLESDAQVYAISLDPGVLGRIRSPLDNYAALTGGDVYFIGSSDIHTYFGRITQQATTQYVLTYVSNNEASADRVVFREIDVRCREPYAVIHRMGYYQAP